MDDINDFQAGVFTSHHQLRPPYRRSDFRARPAHLNGHHGACIRLCPMRTDTTFVEPSSFAGFSIGPSVIPKTRTPFQGHSSGLRGLRPKTGRMPLNIDPSRYSYIQLHYQEFDVLVHIAETVPVLALVQTRSRQSPIPLYTWQYGIAYHPQKYRRGWC